MPDRQCLVSTLLLASALTLLMSLAAAPLRTSESSTTSPRSGCLRRDLALPPLPPTARLNAAIPDDAVLLVNASDAENEEQDRLDALNEPRSSFVVPGSLGVVADHRWIASRTILPRYPLRC